MRSFPLSIPRFTAPRKGWSRLKAVCTILMVMIVGFLSAGSALAQGGNDGKVSRLMTYVGYSEPKYREWVRTSEYVAVRDGTRLAVDIVRPAVDGKPVEDKLPILYIHERYHRARLVNGVPTTQASYVPFWSYWVSHGYILATADMRGTGASFGYRIGELIDQDSTDAYDIIEWLAAKPWSNGNVGMMGVSAQGNSQWLAAGAAPPALKAIVPQMSMFDLYSFAYPGGVFRNEFLKAWGDKIYNLDNVRAPVPVDEDKDGSLLKAAVAEHAKTVGVYDTVQAVPNRDSVFEAYGFKPYEALSLHRLVAGVNKSNVAVYQISGWFDMWPRDQAAWFNNLTRPQRIIFTPFSHGAGLNPGWQEMSKHLLTEPMGQLYLLNFQVIEHLRFFDYHLKGIQNGIMDEPAVWYYVMGAPAGQAWRSSTQWPLADEVRTRFYVGSGPSGSIKSINDGTLATAVPLASADKYTVNYTTTTGDTTRWHNGHGTDFFYPDMTAQGEKSLTYTTEPLKESVEVTGSPIVHLWMSSTASDGDFFVYLEEVSADGYAQYITEGVLRASHRATAEAPFKYMNLPYHRSNAADVSPLPGDGKPVELVIDLHPTSNIFDAGNRIRIRIAGADTGSYLTPKLDPAPVVTIFGGGETASYVDLPVIPAN